MYQNNQRLCDFEEVFGNEIKLTPETRKCARLYFNLCSEEFYLKEHGLVSPEIWNNWADGMTTRMKSPTLQEEWKNMREEEYFDSFRQFMDELIDYNKNQN